MNYVATGARRTIVPGDLGADLLDKPMTMLVESERLPENDLDLAMEDDAWIGENGVIRKGVCIAKNCVIPAGTVIVGNAPSKCFI